MHFLFKYIKAIEISLRKSMKQLIKPVGLSVYADTM